jgi:hypothetical protein
LRSRLADLRAQLTTIEHNDASRAPQLEPLHITIRGLVPSSATSTLVNAMCGDFVAFATGEPRAGSHVPIVYTSCHTNYSDSSDRVGDVNEDVKSFRIKVVRYTADEVSTLVRESLAFLEPSAYAEARKTYETRLTDQRYHTTMLKSTVPLESDGKSDANKTREEEEDPFWDADRLAHGFRTLSTLGFLSREEQRRVTELAQGGPGRSTYRPNRNKTAQRLVAATAVPGGIDSAVSYVTSLRRILHCKTQNMLAFDCIPNAKQALTIIERYSRSLPFLSNSEITALRDRDVPRGSIVSHDRHTVVGRDALTGAPYSLEEEWPLVKRVHVRGPFFLTTGLPLNMVLYELPSNETCHQHATKHAITCDKASHYVTRDNVMRRSRPTNVFCDFFYTNAQGVTNRKRNSSGERLLRAPTF